MILRWTGSHKSQKYGCYYVRKYVREKNWEDSSKNYYMGTFKDPDEKSQGRQPIK